ncbi:MAG: MlaA family lipoprotein [Rhodospirillales bacterium]
MEARVLGSTEMLRKTGFALTCAAFLTAAASPSALAEWGEWDDDEVVLGRAVYLAEETTPDITIEEMLLSQTDDDDDFDDNDPLEDFNRVIFDVNEFLYDVTLRPVAYVYNNFLPDHLRYMLGNLYDTFSLPVTIANNLLQFEFDRAADASARLLLNGVFGFGGLNDLAVEAGIEHHSEDFGQTLAVWGVPEGFYLVLPVFGPSSPRDAVGKFLVDGYFNPMTYYMKVNEHPRDSIAAALRIGGGVHQFADVVDELDDIKKTSIDYYAAVRSLYRQKRASDVSNGEEIDVPAIPELGHELELDEYSADDLARAVEEGEIDPFAGVFPDAGAARGGIETLVAESAENPVAQTRGGVEVSETPLVRSFGSAGSF